jgi:hypothetical protein
MRWGLEACGPAGLGFALLGLAAIGSAEPAQAQCSVLSRHPCTPFYCGLYSRPGCVPQLLLPLNEVPVLRLGDRAGPAEPLDRDSPADRLNEVRGLLSNCLDLPAQPERRSGMRVTLRLAFKRDGTLLAEPRFTYFTPEAPPATKAAYRDAALAMLKRCTPLPVTPGLGSAIAGRPLVMAIIDTRPQNEPASAGAAGDSELKVRHGP